MLRNQIQSNLYQTLPKSILTKSHLHFTLHNVSACYNTDTKPHDKYTIVNLTETIQHPTRSYVIGAYLYETIYHIMQPDQNLPIDYSTMPDQTHTILNRT